MAQAEFLREAMLRLGMTRDQFALRIATKRKTLDCWVLPAQSKESRVMPDMAWQFIREILEKEAGKA